MSDDAERPTEEQQPPPRAAARLAARYASQPTHDGPTSPLTSSDSSPDAPDDETAVAAPWPDHDVQVAAPWPEPSVEGLVLPDAVLPEDLTGHGRATPAALGGLVPADVPLADDFVAGFELPQPRREVEPTPSSIDRAEVDDSGVIALDLDQVARPADAHQHAELDEFSDVVELDALGGSEVEAQAATPHHHHHHHHHRRRKRPSRRAPVATYVAMALFALAVPLLGWLGFHLLSTSKNGTLVTRHHDSSDPGYRALVDTTPTMLFVQRDATGEPTGLTLLALSTADKHGGSIVQIPLDTLLETPLPRITTIREGYEVLGMKGLQAVTSQLLGTGVLEVADVDDARMAELVAPVAPLKFKNPSRVVLPDGRVVPAGDVDLASVDVGPFLSATVEGQSDLERLARNQLVWQAWLDAVHNSKLAASVPGEATTGIGRFVRGLAAGPVEHNTLPVSPVDGTAQFRTDPVLTRLMMTKVVPFPVSASPGQRVLVRVLSGEPGTAVPPSVLQRLVFAGAQISELGNYRAGSIAETTINYASPAQREEVDMMLKYLGAGSAKVVPDTGDSVTVTVIVGKDLLDHPPGGLTPAELGR